MPSPSDNRPISEIYAEVGKDWAEAEAAAAILEDTKSSFLSQMIMNVLTNDPKTPLNRAEAQVKSSGEWIDNIHKTIEARKEANLLKVRLESIRMAYGEWNSEAANERLVAKL